MARKTKLNIEINSDSSLQGLMQEVYNNACNQIIDSQKIITELTSTADPADIDDHTKIARAKTDALKIKDSAIKIKLDVGKLQSDIIKFNGNVASAINNNPEIVSQDSFDKVRDLIKEMKETKN